MEDQNQNQSQRHHHHSSRDNTGDGDADIVQLETNQSSVPVPVPSSRRRTGSEFAKYICVHRKFSLIFLVTILIFCLSTFLCEQGLIFPSACASASVVDNSYDDRIKVKTSDAGIFVGVKKRIKVSPHRDKSTTRNNIAIDTNSPHVDSHHHTHKPDSGSSSSSASQHSIPGVSDSFISNSTENLSEEESSGKSNEKVYYVFKGIPYAKIGDRWEDPQVVDIKSSAQDNTKYKPVCSQWSEKENKPIGSTDCLYLNIHTPHIPPPLRRPFLINVHTVQDIFYQQRHLYPVLIYIHGGDFLSGSGNDYGAKKLLLSEDVCLVTFSYRLGVFGFLSSGDEAIPGNYGLLDQLKAIKWVQKYIQRFGGNPTRMTIFGDVGYLLLSPLAVGLFQGAIITSDSMSIFSPPGNKSIQSDPHQLIREIAASAKCPVAPLSSFYEKGNSNRESREMSEEGEEKIVTTDKTKEMMIECLKLKPADDLIRIQHEMTKFHTFPRRFVPVIDVGFRDFPVMMSDPEKLMEMGTLVKVPIISGVNQLEGYSMLMDFTHKLGFANLRYVAKIRETLYENLNYVLEERTRKIYDTVFDAIWKFYFGQESDQRYSKGLTKKLLTLFGDLKTHAGFWKLSKKLTRNSKPPAFAYVFSHRVNEFDNFFRQHAAGNYSKKNNNITLSVKNRSSRSNSQDTHMNSVIIPPWQDLHYILETTADKFQSLNFSSLSSASQLNDSHFGREIGEDGNTLRKLSMEETMVKIWTSFSNYGTPKLAVGKFENWTRWQRIETHSVRYYDLSMHPMSMKTSFRNTEALFWYETLAEVRAAAQKAEEEEEVERQTMIWWIILISSILSFFILVGLIYYCCFT